MPLENEGSYINLHGLPSDGKAVAETRSLELGQGRRATETLINAGQQSPVDDDDIHLVQELVQTWSRTTSAPSSVKKETCHSHV